MGVLDRYIVVYTQSRVSNWPFSHGPYMEDIQVEKTQTYQTTQWREILR